MSRMKRWIMLVLLGGAALGAGASLAIVSVGPGVSPAVGLGLPTVSVPVVKTIPTVTVPVTVPTVPVKTPTVPVKTPTVPVKTPTVPVKTPTVPVKTPTVPVKTPAVPGKTTTTIPLKAPGAPVGTDPGSLVKSTTTGASAPVTRVAAGVVKASGTTTTSRGGPDAGSRSSGTDVGGQASQGVGGPGSSPPETLGAPAFSGYGTEPTPPEVVRILSQGRGVALDQARVKMLVRGLARCLPQLPSRQRRLLELRSGFGEPYAYSAQTTATKLHLTPKQIMPLERIALTSLRTAVANGGCTVERSEGGTFAFASYSSGSVGPGAGGVAGALYLKAAGLAKPVAQHADTSVPLAIGPVRLGSSIFWTLVVGFLGTLVILTLARSSLGLSLVPSRRRLGRSAKRGPRRR